MTEAPIAGTADRPKGKTSSLADIAADHAARMRVRTSTDAKNAWTKMEADMKRAVAMGNSKPKITKLFEARRRSAELPPAVDAVVRQQFRAFLRQHFDY